MEPSNDLIDYAIKVAARVARNGNLDRNTAVSIACEHAVVQARKVETEVDSFKLLATVLQRRLVTDVLDELRVFGPSSNTQIQRKRRQQRNQTNHKREASDVIHYDSTAGRTRVVRTRSSQLRPSGTHIIDFLDQFESDQDLLRLAMLMLAGYNQTELIREFGYTRTQLAQLKERLANVLQKH